MAVLCIHFSKTPKHISCQLAAAMQRGEKANFYQVLSLPSQNVGFEDIKKAYTAVALQHHPDVCTPLSKEESTRRFIELKMAYETLSDPSSCRMYDFELGLGDVEKRRESRFPRGVWERRLNGLKEEV